MSRRNHGFWRGRRGRGVGYGRKRRGRGRSHFGGKSGGGYSGDTTRKSMVKFSSFCDPPNMKTISLWMAVLEDMYAKPEFLNIHPHLKEVRNSLLHETRGRVCDYRVDEFHMKIVQKEVEGMIKRRQPLLDENYPVILFRYFIISLREYAYNRKPNDLFFQKREVPSIEGKKVLQSFLSDSAKIIFDEYELSVAKLREDGILNSTSRHIPDFNKGKILNQERNQIRYRVKRKMRNFVLSRSHHEQVEEYKRNHPEFISEATGFTNIFQVLNYIDNFFKIRREEELKKEIASYTEQERGFFCTSLEAQIKHISLLLSKSPKLLELMKAMQNVDHRLTYESIGWKKEIVEDMLRALHNLLAKQDEIGET